MRRNRNEQVCTEALTNRADGNKNAADGLYRIVKLHHAAALGLICWFLMAPLKAVAEGWYLMEPPNQADLDTSCQAGGSPSWSDYLTAARRWMAPSNARLRRCENELFVFVPQAPVSRWIQVDVDKDLDNCKAEVGLAKRESVVPDPWLRSQIAKYDSEWQAELDSITKRMEKDPVFNKDRKDWDQATREKCRRMIPDDIFMVEILRQAMCEGSDWEPEKESQLCIASDDPRLKEK